MTEQANAINSPCISICRMDETSGWCEGCLRTIDEIAAWTNLNDAGKKTVLSLIEERRIALRPQDWRDQDLFEGPGPVARS